MYSRQDPNAEVPVQIAIGKNEKGQFCTMEHEEYPPFFCSALAGALVDEIARRRDRAIPSLALTDDLKQWVAEALSVCKCIHTGAAILPDYQGH